MIRLSLLESMKSSGGYCTMDSPVGSLCLLGSDKGLSAIMWDYHFTSPKFPFREEYKSALKQMKKDSEGKVLKKAVQQIKEYFQGDRCEFDIPLDIEGTQFQKKAWRTLQTIGFGETLSYQNQAQRLGDLKKCRAVGQANSQNPVPIIIPCHRVIAKNGSLGGFTGGLKIKEFLLEHEVWVKHSG